MTDAPTIPNAVRAVLAGPVLEVAPRLLGATLTHRTPEGSVTVRLTEVEAYDGANDPGSHAFRGRTDRNAVMFGPAGHLYVYFTYGMHFCANLVCGPDGRASAVLMRAGEIVEGARLAEARRPAARTARDLARGPARLARALGLDRACNGLDALTLQGPLHLELAPQAYAQATARSIRTGPRVGLAQAADRPWRFWLDGEPTVSVYRPHTPKNRARTRPLGRTPENRPDDRPDQPTET